MNNVRKQSKLLAALLALLMVLSTVIALPVVAEENQASGLDILWSADLSTWGVDGAGTGNGNVRDGKDGVTEAKLVSALSGTLNLANALNNDATIKTSNIHDGAKLISGMFRAGGSGTLIAGSGAGKYGFYELMTGLFYRDGQQMRKYIVEFDYQVDEGYAPGNRSSSNVTISGEEGTFTVYSSFSDGGYGYQMRLRTGGTNGYMFRVSPNGYIYTSSSITTVRTSATGVDGYLYYEESDKTKVYFDAEGYRYKLVNGEKDYIDDLNDAAPVVSGIEIGTGLGYDKIDQGYKLQFGKRYRMRIEVIAPEASSSMSVKHAVYIQLEDGTGKRLGASSQTTSNEASNLQYIIVSGTNYTSFGGNIIAYTCNGNTHVEGMYTLTDKVSADGVAYQELSCSHCGGTGVQKDGVAYTATTKGNACGGYKLWTAADGSGKMFVTDVVSGAHNYDGNGKCSKCATFEFLAEGFPNSGDPGKSVATDVLPDATTPYYDKASGCLIAPDSGMIRTALQLDDYNKPFVMSFNFCIDEKQENSDSTKPQWWPLVSYHSSAEGYLVYVRDNGAGLSITLGSQSFIHARYNLEYGEWYNICIAVDPATKHVIAYLNGEYFGMTKGIAVINASNSSAAFRIGMNSVTTTAYRFAYKVDDLNFYQLKDASEIYTTQASNVIASLKYDTNSYSRISNAMGNGTITAFGTSSSSFRTSNIVDNKYGILSGKAYKEISLSTAFGDKEYNLSDKKYEIHIKFAVPSADEDGTGMPDATETGSLNLVRLSKYNDPIQSVLMGRTKKGEYTANGKTLCDISGKSLSFVRDFDENGAPIGGASELSVVVDEKNNSYSVYVDGCVAYYKEGSTLVPFMNVTMPYAKGDVKDEVSSYGEITKEMANNAGYTKFAYQYLRVFRDIKTVAVEELTISLVGDRDVEFVGAQVKTADQGAAAETFDLRFLFGLDDLFSDSVGFQIKAYKNGVQVGNTYETSVENEIKTVFKSVDAANGYFDSYSAFETDKGHYLAAFKITGIEETNSNDVYRFEIVPYTRAVSPAHDVEEATKVCADTVYVVCCDGLGNNVFTQAIDNN